MKSWPNDVDGDVFRSLERQGFDFDKEYIVDFNVDFYASIPSDAVNRLKQSYPLAEITAVTESNPPYIKIQTRTKLRYDIVTRMQHDLTEKMKSLGGWCDSWGVLH